MKSTGKLPEVKPKNPPTTVAKSPENEGPSLTDVPPPPTTRNENEIYPPEKIGEQLAIERLAINIALSGASLKDAPSILERCNQKIEILLEPDSPSYKYLIKRVEELRQAKATIDNQKRSASDDLSDSTKKRKTRWDTSSGSTSFQIFNIDEEMKQYALKVYGHLDLEQEQWTQLEDQKKMQTITRMIEEKKRLNELNAGKLKFEYDSDEDVDGGTWEHKKRAEEMGTTKDWADNLTSSASGKHHIGDFLPLEELKKFQEKWEAMKNGTSLDISDYRDNKLTESNIGYRMMQSMGWKEGDGLGASGTGITAPINRATAASENAGLGQSRPCELETTDDQYETYRKRMMISYRYRPNPLNNPRRSYY